MAGNNDSNGELSLSIAGSDEPFALVGREQHFGPDDWAWQFLRLNHSYQRDYATALEAHDPEDDCPPGALAIPKKHRERKIRIKERYCRMRYGLSTWLDPQNTRLPQLNRGESWFFPLNRSPDSPEEPSLRVAVEGVFAYWKVPFLGSFDRKRAERAGVTMQLFSRQDVWFAVDCSVPPFAQMKSVELISRLYRDWLREMKAEMHSRDANSPKFLPLKECSWFEAEAFDTASAPAEKVAPNTVWFAIRIDVLEPIKEQVKEHLGRLNAKYLDLCKKGSAEPPVRERFRIELKGPRDDDGEYLSDGNFLKALVICAQLAQRGLDEDGTTQFIRKHAEKSLKAEPQTLSNRDNWNLGFLTRVVNYREHARSFVKGGYRWLVHAKKP